MPCVCVVVASIRRVPFVVYRFILFYFFRLWKKMAWVLSTHPAKLSMCVCVCALTTKMWFVCQSEIAIENFEGTLKRAISCIWVHRRCVYATQFMHIAYREYHLIWSQSGQYSYSWYHWYASVDHNINRFSPYFVKSGIQRRRRRWCCGCYDCFALFLPIRLRSCLIEPLKSLKANKEGKKIHSTESRMTLSDFNYLCITLTWLRVECALNANRKL